jgi:formylglycine-generating enzyme required for sulfatase activity
MHIEGSRPARTSGRQEAQGVSDPGSPEAGLNLVGQLLKDRYRVEQELSRGAFETVYQAVDQQTLLRPVAIKTPHPRFLRQEGFVERLQADLQELVELEHPHLASIKDLGLHEGVPFLVLQHFAGGSLRERLVEQKRLLPEEITPWLSDVARALDFLHKKGLLHRDVRPETILFDAEGNAYLGDFGIVRTLAALHLGLSAAGEAPGPFTYLPPEIGTSPTLGPASDQYALAATVYEALAGRLPHQAPTPAMLMVRKATEPAEPLERSAAFVPPGAVEAVMKSLAMWPEKRFACCVDLAQAYQAGLQAPPEPAPRGVLPLPWAPPPLPVQPLSASPLAAAATAAAAAAAAALPTGSLAAAADTHAGSPPAMAPMQREPRPVIVLDLPRPLPPRRRSGRIGAAWLVLVFSLILLGAHHLGLFDPSRSDVVVLPGGGKLKLVWIPGGAFEMGCTPLDTQCAQDERPSHLVQVDGFWLGRYEVTQRQWQAVMGEDPSVFVNCGPDCPVENVSWRDTQRFLKRARHGLRLPSEAEWEYAARAAGADLRHGDPVPILGKFNAPALDVIAWYGGNSGAEYPGADDCSEWPEVEYLADTCGAQPVGEKRPNLYGLYDMLGNVWEWCQDAYRDDAYAQRKGFVTSPLVSGDVDSFRVLRGGSWREEARHVRASERLALAAGAARNDVGFRVARSGGIVSWDWP